MAVEPEKDEDELEKDGSEAGEVSLVVSVVQSCSKSQYHSLTQTVFEMIQFKMPCETYDPLWLISRLNTDVM